MHGRATSRQLERLTLQLLLKLDAVESADMTGCGLIELDEDTQVCRETERGRSGGGAAFACLAPTERALMRALALLSLLGLICHVDSC